MSEIGPTSVRPRFLCRMISCPAAKGIICSICRPSATKAPSGTHSAMALGMVRSLDIKSWFAYCSLTLFSLPHWLPFFQEGVDSLANIFGLHQLFQIESLGSCQALVEVHRVPHIGRFFGDSKHGGTEFQKALHGFAHRWLDLDVRK